MFTEKLLTGRRILVTGGGTGLGKAMAARFLELGAEIHICGRRKMRLRRNRDRADGPAWRPGD